MATADAGLRKPGRATAAGATKDKRSPAKIDLSTAAGIVLAFGAIIGGLLLEKGNVRDIAQYTAAIIVFGGTFGAVMVSTPTSVLKGSLKRMKSVFREDEANPRVLIAQIIDLSSRARKNGLVSIEMAAMEVEEPFLKKGLGLAIDGTDLQELRKMMELEITVSEHVAEGEAKVFESAGGYAPTIGIIGAVMGLIQVMKNLANIDEVGHGIAVAFVATVYGVASSNILFLPMAAKIKSRIQHESQMRELMLEGVLGIAEGLNPKLLESKLAAFLYGHEEPAAKRGGSKAGKS
jgi:chemotaxis protein MotA